MNSNIIFLIIFILALVFFIAAGNEYLRKLKEDEHIKAENKKLRREIELLEREVYKSTFKVPSIEKGGIKQWK